MFSQERIFILHVQTGKEKAFCDELDKNYPQFSHKIRFPRKRMIIRRGGKKKVEEQPLYPGYLFLLADQVTAEAVETFKNMRGFYKILPQNENPASLPEEEQRLLNQLFIHGEEVLAISKANFDVDGKIRILEGPLKGQEGRIVKVDKRKGRAKIVLDFYDNPYPIDLSFETIEISDSSSG